jgi:hypothetical protein
MQSLRLLFESHRVIGASDKWISGALMHELIPADVIRPGALTEAEIGATNGQRRGGEGACH